MPRNKKRGKVKVNPNCTLALPGELLKISIIGSHFHRTLFNRFGFEKNIDKLVLNEGAGGCEGRYKKEIATSVLGRKKCRAEPQEYRNDEDRCETGKMVLGDQEEIQSRSPCTDGRQMRKLVEQRQADGGLEDCSV